MQEGWYEDTYWTLFEREEAAAYAIVEFLPGYRLVGLRDWDDLIVEAPSGGLCAVPAVPIDTALLESVGDLPPASALVAEPELRGRVKWYVQPLVFGGSPDADENLAWITLPEHAQLVRWWNQKYREIRAQQLGA